MKKNSTIGLSLLCALFLLVTSVNAQVSTTTPVLNFSAAPTLVSGTLNAVNSKYRFSNVKTGTDAVVTIVSATGGASVQILDDNALTMPEAFSPNVRILQNSTGMVEFKIELVITNTTTPHLQDSVYATAIDIDGGSNLKEKDVINMGGGSFSYWMSTPEITVVQNGNDFTGTNVAGNEYPSVDTSAKQVMFTVRKNHAHTFTYKCGATNTSNSNIDRQKSLYFKNFLYPQNGGPLPVKYLSFDAVVNDKSVLLKWITAQELNNSHFEVERSFNNNDFKTLGLVLDGFTNNGSGKSYQYKDNSAELNGKTIAYYRLKQIDIDGKATYSKVLVVRMQAKVDVSMQVSPSPFVENLNVRFAATENGQAQVRIINSNGQTMLSKQSSIMKGYNNIQVDGLKGLAAGMYIAQLIMNGTVIDNQRVIKN